MCMSPLGRPPPKRRRFKSDTRPQWLSRVQIAAGLIDFDSEFLHYRRPFRDFRFNAAPEYFGG